MKHYFEHLDTVRFYAVFMVIFAHIFQIWTWDANTVLLFPIGNTGVIIFFVLSGFLITKILLSESMENTLISSFKNFYGRRTLRIFPIYYLYLLIIFWFNLENINQSGVMPWLYLTNIYMFNENSWLGANSHLWTLSIEEQFYLIWPFLVLLLRDYHKTLLLLFVVIIAIAISARGYLFLNSYSISPQIEVFTLTNLDSLTFGGVLALAYLRYQNLLKKYALAIIVFALVAYYLLLWLKLSFAWSLLFWTIGKFFVVICSAGIILYAIFANNKQNLFHNPITIHLGKISYGLYLYHNIVVAHYDKIAQFFFIPINEHIITKVILSLLFTISLAQLSFMMIEKPFLKLKHYFS